ncbi:nitroimidazol reductase NimA-like FMN-containing flavoprotein (pyridoxamine 5'-phosphate oxidase superfamily)/DNA-binding XRE family transcriptional regulator [Streptosporangium album]|uniref:Nitroimidazol reductase NimA-like FMN-containing flavoprotein (Pyridoxamine 5'-phosphate oxidase superfamily)/DNA-binding XRE family transcriptional regulator n=1 Tax=Streptosporangium album TaxID=47479 RepID=A0A7W7S1W2_9ACTN|nr:pyridoxamine 5'-phosphate oxidase family protein [Streptosporangium album]MBB4942408.1 nitroimidazol reductase NimA-like FMN-containing flavoprotein (pyridoxamine 5'-phosphate oxidase superfamily)/DNA-binding XRE family transcriptional regulator [Streptosporangium album]
MTEHISAPGDLGRRIMYHRKSLGMTREQLAERARIDPGYLGYLEESAASPGASTVNQLAAALGTSSEELLGGTVDMPQERGPAGAQPWLEKLDADECMRLISPGGVGRVGFTDPAGPVVLPVNYVIHHGAVLLRTAFGGPLDENLRTGVRGVEFKIAFEVDHTDDPNRQGWSVLVRGAAHHLSEEERAVAASADVEPWAGGERELSIRIAPAEITGRRIHHSPE